jgi:hypothetical protein
VVFIAFPCGCCFCGVASRLQPTSRSPYRSEIRSEWPATATIRSDFSKRGQMAAAFVVSSSDELNGAALGAERLGFSSQMRGWTEAFGKLPGHTHHLGNPRRTWGLFLTQVVLVWPVEDSTPTSIPALLSPLMGEHELRVATVGAREGWVHDTWGNRLTWWWKDYGSRVSRGRRPFRRPWNVCCLTSVGKGGYGTS